ncbi:hypothetical protein MGN70_005282 [Eutypa lata]|nr:hypothetical protein MGN70_005282 [Eutypa lata]
MSQSSHNENSSSSPTHQEPQSQARNASSQEPAAASTTSSQAEMARAFKDLASCDTEADSGPITRGEQHAAALEANLTSLESKLDALLASIEGGAALVDQGQDGTPESDKNEKNGSK